MVKEGHSASAWQIVADALRVDAELGLAANEIFTGNGWLHEAIAL